LAGIEYEAISLPELEASGLENLGRTGNQKAAPQQVRICTTRVATKFATIRGTSSFSTFCFVSQQTLFKNEVTDGHQDKPTSEQLDAQVISLKGCQRAL
jgi:hypothetical protein